jgi:hypothetical protein
MHFVTTVIQDSLSIYLKINITLVQSLTQWKFCILQKRDHISEPLKHFVFIEKLRTTTSSVISTIQPNTVFKAILLDSYDDHPRA